MMIYRRVSAGHCRERGPTHRSSTELLDLRREIFQVRLELLQTYAGFLFLVVVAELNMCVSNSDFTTDNRGCFTWIVT